MHIPHSLSVFDTVTVSAGSTIPVPRAKHSDGMEPDPVVVIIRHGKTENNKLGIFTGTTLTASPHCQSYLSSNNFALSHRMAPSAPLHVRLAGCGTRSRGEGRGSSCGEAAAETRLHLRCRVHKVRAPHAFFLSFHQLVDNV